MLWRHSSPEPVRVEVDQSLRRRLLVLAAASSTPSGSVPALGLAVLGGIGVYVYFAARCRRCPTSPPITGGRRTTPLMRAWDGTPLAELATERREILPFDSFPPAARPRLPRRRGPPLLRAPAASTTAASRARWAPTCAPARSRRAARPSRSRWRSRSCRSERTIQRKIREAILARRLERRYSKREILTLYLNQIFLGPRRLRRGGGGAPLLRQADRAISTSARWRSSPAWCARRRASRRSPASSAARARRDQVLAAMVAAGYLTDDEANHWRARPVIVRQRPDFFRTVSPYFAEHVRRDIVRRYGEKKLCEGRPRHRDHGRALDRRRRRRRTSTSRCASSTSGRAGAARSRTSPAAAADEFRRRVAARYGGEPPAEGRLYLGLVEGATGGDGATACASASGVYPLPSAEHDCGPSPTAPRTPTNGKTLDSTGRRAAPRRRRLGEERAPVEAARASPTGPTTRKSEVQWLPAYDETQRQAAEAPAAGRADAGADAARAGDASSATTTSTGYVRGDGGRRRLRPLGVQPRRRRPAASPARPTSRSTTRWRSTAATASRRC